MRKRSHIEIKNLVTLFILGSAMVSTNCQHTTFTSNSFRHKYYDYKIRYSDPDAHSFLKREWIVKNYKKNAYGRIEHSEKDRFQGYLLTDIDNNKVPERTKVRLVDLMMIHKKSKGCIWVSTRTLQGKHAKHNLPRLARNFADSIIETKTPIYSDVYGEKRILSQKFLVDIKKSSSKKFDQQDAIDTTFAVSRTDDWILDENNHDYLTRIIIIRLDSRLRGKVKITNIPAVLVIGYADKPENFKQGLKDFEIFLSAIMV